MYQLVDWWNGGFDERIVFIGTLDDCKARMKHSGNTYGEDGTDIRDMNCNVILRDC